MQPTMQPAPAPVRPSVLPRILDGLVLLLLSCLAAWLFFHSRTRSALWAGLLTGLFALCVAAATYAWQARKYRQHTQKLRRIAYRLWLSDQILASDNLSFEVMVLGLLQSGLGYRYLPSTQGPDTLLKDGKRSALTVLKRHPACPVDAQMVLAAVDTARKEGYEHLLLVASSGFDAAAQAFAGKVPDLDMQLMDLEALADLAYQEHYGRPVDNLSSYAAEAREVLRQQHRRPKRFAQWTRPLRFAVSGLALAALGFLTPYRQWYWTIAALCVGIALIQLVRAFIRSTQEAAQSSK